jgi:hypothetical protein
LRAFIAGAQLEIFENGLRVQRRCSQQDKGGGGQQQVAHGALQQNGYAGVTRS